MSNTNNNTKKNPNDWLPITKFRNAKWWYSAL